MKKTAQIVLLIFFSGALFAAEESSFSGGIFQHAVFSRPFWADMHSTIIRIEAAYASNSPDYDWGEFNTKFRPFLFFNFGLDIPIWSGNFAGEKYGFSVTLPFAMDIWYDRFERETSPIINTSYRFSAFDAAFIYRLNNPLRTFPGNYFYNWGLKLSLLKHESTHIGDELAVFRKNQDFEIARIDTLTNFIEMTVTLNDPDGRPRRNHGFKFGFLFNYNYLDGWYTVFESEAQADLVDPSRFPFEIFFQYQYQSPVFWRKFQVIASAEYRIRERYNYPYYDDGGTFVQNEENPLAHCVNLFTGIRYDNHKNTFFSKVGIGLRYYYGINPYGQFRSMPHYHQFGLAVIFE